MNKKWKLYKDNLQTNFEVPNLIDILDKNFKVISEKLNSANECIPSKYSINNAVHISLSDEILKEVIENINSEFDNKYTYYQMKMSILFEDILNDAYSAIIIYGMPLQNGEFSEKYYIIDKKTILQHADVIKIHNALESIKFGNYDKNEYYEKIKNLNMYFIGNKDLINALKDENGKYIIPTGAHIYLREDDENNNTVRLFLGEITYKATDGSEHTALKVFASEYSAFKYGGNKEIVCKMPLCKIKELYNGPVIIEPHRNWWIEF